MYVATFMSISVTKTFAESFKCETVVVQAITEHIFDCSPCSARQKVAKQNLSRNLLGVGYLCACTPSLSPMTHPEQLSRELVVAMKPQPH